MEWYFGYRYPHMDLNCEDWRSRDLMWDQTRHALDFFQRYLPFHEMEPLADATEGSPSRVLAKTGQTYAVQLMRGGTLKLQLEPGKYSVAWYNPRAGGPLLKGSVSEVEGGRQRPYLGEPPSDPGKDWVILVRRTK